MKKYLFTLLSIYPLAINAMNNDPYSIYIATMWQQTTVTSLSYHCFPQTTDGKKTLIPVIGSSIDAISKTNRHNTGEIILEESRDQQKTIKTIATETVYFKPQSVKNFNDTLLIQMRIAVTLLEEYNTVLIFNKKQYPSSNSQKYINGYNEYIKAYNTALNKSAILLHTITITENNSDFNSWINPNRKNKCIIR